MILSVEVRIDPEERLLGVLHYLDLSSSSARGHRRGSVGLACRRGAVGRHDSRHLPASPRQASAPETKLLVEHHATKVSLGLVMKLAVDGEAACDADLLRVQREDLLVIAGRPQRPLRRLVMHGCPEEALRIGNNAGRFRSQPR